MNIKDEVKQALDSPKISTIDEQSLRTEYLRKYIFDAYENMGMNTSEGKGDRLSFRMMDYCHYYKYLTIRDIENIVHFGSIGFWGESFRLNMQVIHKWFAEYVKERAIVLHDIDRSDNCTVKERLQFLYKNKDKLPYFKSLIDKPRKPGRRGLKQISDV